MVDELDPKVSESGPRRGGWLHIDASMGIAGDMLTAALLDLGAPERVLREALIAARLLGVGPRTERERRAGLVGTSLTFLDRAGRALEVVDVPPDLRRAAPRRTSVRTKPRPAPHRDRRRQDAVAELGIAASTEDQELPSGVIQLPTATPPAQAPADIEPEPFTARLLADERVRGEELEAHLASSRLDPITAALARKTLRLFLDGIASVEELDRADVELPGRAALDVLCDVVGACALVAWLNPGRITASPVLVSTAAVRTEDGDLLPGPGPALTSVLGEVPTVERDLPWAPATPTGAALVRALARRHGPRGLSITERVGTGVGSLDPPGVANVCRCFLGPLPDVATVEGSLSSQSPVGVVLVVASLEAAPRAPLRAALERAGARDLRWAPETTDDEGSGVELRALVSSSEVEAVVDQLFTASASRVLVGPVSVRRPATRELTVALGGPQKPRAVRVLASMHAGRLVRLSPDDVDLGEAARSLGISLEQARAQTLALAEATPAVTADDDAQSDEGDQS